MPPPLDVGHFRLVVGCAGSGEGIGFAGWEGPAWGVGKRVGSGNWSRSEWAVNGEVVAQEGDQVGLRSTALGLVATPEREGWKLGGSARAVRFECGERQHGEGRNDGGMESRD